MAMLTIMQIIIKTCLKVEISLKDDANILIK